jgi:hypothetical protein
VFNALRPDELLLGVGRVLRSVASTEGPLEEYVRSQTLSAYSVTRLLAAEQVAAAGLLAFTKGALAEVLAGDGRPEVARCAERVEAAADGVAVGEALSDLLAGLGPDDPLSAALHGVLAQMIDREVAALAAARR